MASFLSKHRVNLEFVSRPTFAYVLRVLLKNQHCGLNVDPTASANGLFGRSIFLVWVLIDWLIVDYLAKLTERNCYTDL